MVVWEVVAIVRIAGVCRMTKSSRDGGGESESEFSSGSLDSSSEVDLLGVGSGKGMRAA